MAFITKQFIQAIVPFEYKSFTCYKFSVKGKKEDVMTIGCR